MYNVNVYLWRERKTNRRRVYEVIFVDLPFLKHICCISFIFGFSAFYILIKIKKKHFQL